MQMLDEGKVTCLASNLEFVEYVCNQISGAGNISYKKMFGDYGIYCNSKIIGVICENQFFVKKTAAGESLYPGFEEASPYSGAKLHFVMDCLDDKELMDRFIKATYDELPEPKKKR